jgi:hypothetical protein
MRKNETFSKGLLLALVIALVPSPAYAVAMKFTIEVHIENGELYELGESRPSPASMQSEMLRYCKTEYEDFNVGSQIKAVSGNGATVGLGKVTSVKIGKIYKKEIRLYGNQEDDPEEEGTLYDQYFAPCIFSGSISNLRSSAFYKFYIGSVRTSEYDSKNLQKYKWSLNLWLSEISCYNYEKSWSGCTED